MPLSRHLMFAAGYGGAALLAMLTLRYGVDGVSPEMAVIVGAVILIVGIVVHEVYTREQRERKLHGHILQLARSRDALLDQLADTRIEISDLRLKMADQREKDRKLDEVTQEVEMLQSLVSRMTGGLPDRSYRAPVRQTLETANLSEADLLMVIRDAVRHERIDIVMQPIVSLPQRKLRFFQLYSQIRTPERHVLKPEQYMPIAERSGFAPAIDNILLLHSIQLARGAVKTHSTIAYVATISARTLRDQTFMDEFVSYLRSHPELGPQLIFELPYEAAADLETELRASMERLAGLGSRFAMADVFDLVNLDADRLARHAIKYFKVDAATLLREVHYSATGLDIHDLKARLDRNAIDLIVDRIDTDEVLVEVLDLPVDFGQGFLLGDPVTR